MPTIIAIRSARNESSRTLRAEMYRNPSTRLRTPARAGAPPVGDVRDRPAPEAEHRERDERDEPGQPHVRGRPGDVVELLGDRDDRQLAAELGDDARRPQPPVGRDAQRPGVHDEAAEVEPPLSLPFAHSGAFSAASSATPNPPPASRSVLPPSPSLPPC